MDCRISLIGFLVGLTSMGGSLLAPSCSSFIINNDNDINNLKE